MQEENIPLSFVVNEFGSVEGIVTKEDIAEEIVGEIQTRDHPNEELLKRISGRKCLANGSLDIDFLHRRFGISIEKKGFETLAGFVTSQLGKIPKRGDRLVYQKYTFIVEEATARSVERVMIISPPGRSLKR
jgi:CBS domain containing-hemolysin-like protein